MLNVLKLLLFVLPWIYMPWYIAIIQSILFVIVENFIDVEGEKKK